MVVLSFKANKCSDAGTGDLGVLTAHETSLMTMTKLLSLHQATWSILLVMPQVQVSEETQRSYSRKWFKME